MKEATELLVFEKKVWRAHRVSFTFFCGEIPHGKHVLHKCDNRCCVNPDHLFLGTHKENMHDMIKKGKGILFSQDPEKCGQSKLNWEQITMLRSKKNWRRGDATYFAKLFGVSVTCISYAVRSKTWK